MTGKRPILEVIEEIEADLNIFLDLKEKAPGRFDGLCPFHKDSNPSFSVYLNNSPDDSRWICWTCDPDGGDVIDFIRKARDTSFADAVKEGTLEISEYDQIIRDFLQPKTQTELIAFQEQLQLVQQIREYNKQYKDFKKVAEAVEALKAYTKTTKYTVRRLLK